MPDIRLFRVCLSIALMPLMSHAQSAVKTPGGDGSLTEELALEMPEIIIEGKAESLIGIATSASKGQTSTKELMARPFSRRGELLESIPGFIATQHSGDGKANQYYLRGTNLDHGTDFAIYVDGMPVNLRNHAHGQGYADTNFIIPELVGQLEYGKGTYYAQHGDLSSTGAARFKLLDALPQGILSTTWGEYDYSRTLIADTIQAGAGQLTVALEHQYYNGPWDLHSDATRLNGFLRWHWEDARDKINLTFMGYHGKWKSTDQVPQRVVESGLIGRYGNLDPTDGGNSQRYSLSFDWVRNEGRTTTRANAYAGFYDLDLFSNFTFFMDSIARGDTLGDQFEQKDHRWFLGGELARDWRFDAMGQEQRFTLGIQLRTDIITGLGLYNTSQRERWNTVRQDDITQSTYGLYVEAELKPVRWLRIIPGLRGDVFQFNVEKSNLPENAGSLTKGIVSPKLSMVFGPWAKTEFYVNAGMGFHSNDARGVNITTDPNTGGPADRVNPLVRTYGAEFGIRNESIPKLVNTLSFWMLHSDSELIYTGDAGTTEPGAASMRQGIELSSYWRPEEWVMLDIEATLTEAHLVNTDPPNQKIPNSIPYTFNGGITLGGAQGFFGSLRARYFAPRPLDSVVDVKTRESLQVNARLGYRHKNLEIALDCLNLLNRSDYDVAYYYASQLKSDAAPVNDVHVHPIEPRMFRLSVTYRF
ncbi:MAG: TonB-dependent receptor plug domain-containing protein [Prosthecobacter sp.]|uniref:TonB-dependent receptor n=1 Tax=Prosthecobacter sp. TaxID=1965333 RepID=UPI0025D7B1B2|nr:TonB-dependent receptor [Prosthecobacter sp.]MCF7786315.1 TonB-dependent receptor plug domain-containing protein [Prosthecobacter sp.]